MSGKRLMPIGCDQSAKMNVGWAVSMRHGIDWIARTAADAGLHSLQISRLPEMDTSDGVRTILAAAQSIDADLVAVTFGFANEDWSDIPSIFRTCGLVPPEHRAQRLEALHRTAAFAHRLGVRHLSGHLGRIPEQEDDLEGLREDVRQVCEAFADHDQLLLLETGQESAAQLADFITRVGHPNLRVNFDPANFILYSQDEPMNAWRILRPWVSAIHCKDANPPTDPRHLGAEVPLGTGSVDFTNWLAHVLACGYTGPLIIETGVKGEQLPHDLLCARLLIERIARGPAARA